MYVLSQRRVRDWLRNPTLLASELTQYVFIGLFIGLMVGSQLHMLSAAIYSLDAGICVCRMVSAFVFPLQYHSTLAYNTTDGVTNRLSCLWFAFSVMMYTPVSARHVWSLDKNQTEAARPSLVLSYLTCTLPRPMHLVHMSSCKGKGARVCKCAYVRVCAPMLLVTQSYTAVINWDKERQLLKRETHQRLYSIFTAYTARTLVLLPFQAVQCVLFVLIMCVLHAACAGWLSL